MPNQASPPSNPSELKVWKDLRNKGYTIYRNGWPAILAERSDEIRAIEVKGNKYERLTPEQIKAMELLSKLGVKCQRWSPDTGFQEYTFHFTKGDTHQQYKKAIRNNLIYRLYKENRNLRMVDIADMFHTSKQRVHQIINENESSR